MNTEDDIESVFRKMEERLPHADEGAKQTLHMLVHTALSFRDRLVERKEPPLTVGETQEALDAFMVVIRTQTFPEIDDPRVKELVLMWLEEVRKTVHH